MKKIIILTFTLVLLSLTAEVNAKSILKLQQAELEGFDKSEKTLVFGGEKYNYNFEPENSRYRFSDDLKKSVNFSSLKLNETYYFQVKVQVGDSKKNKYNTVTFIAKSKPAE